MGGARALRFAERLRLSRTLSVAGGWTMACSTSRPPVSLDFGVQGRVEVVLGRLAVVLGLHPLRVGPGQPRRRVGRAQVRSANDRGADRDPTQPRGGGSGGRAVTGKRGGRGLWLAQFD